MKKALLVLVCFIFSFGVIEKTSAKSLPIELFAKKSNFNSIKLSPDGKYFAATVPKDNTTQLVVIKRSTMKVVIAYAFGDFEHIGRFYWLNNQRLVYTKSYQKGSQEQKVTKGEIFAANIDGSKRVQLFGVNASKSKIKSKRSLRAYGKILHMLPDDNAHILVSVRNAGDDIDVGKKIFKINTYNQKRKLITKTPFGNFSVTLTNSGQPFAGSGKDRQGKKHSYLYVNNRWQELDNNQPLNDYKFVSVNNNGSILYLQKSVDGGTNGLYQYQLATQKLSLLFNDPKVDIAEFIKEPASNTIVGVKTMFDGVKYHYLDNDNAFSQLHQKLVAAFTNHDIKIYANSIEDNEIIVLVSSDRIPGDYYLFDQKKKNVSFLLSKKPWLDPNVMMPRQVINFIARDGMKIYGYLTLPKKSKLPAPLIVDVHGGPFGVQDKWHFNTDAQLLANQGYAVLQINFRGSGGYGKRYEEVAYQLRDSLIQHDIIDGTRWALAKDNIDDKKVCIIGGSFGGYAALMAPLIEPDLYKCAIPRYGPYDMVYQMKNADYMSKDSVSFGAMEKYGDNETLWLAQSPLTYIDKLKTPLLIVTGGKDKRVPPQSALNLRDALDERNMLYQWLYKSKEGHGFTNSANKIELYQKSLAFIEEYINQ